MVLCSSRSSWEEKFQMEIKKEKKKKQMHSAIWRAYHTFQWVFYPDALKVVSYYHKIAAVKVMLSAYSISCAVKPWMGSWWNKNARHEERNIIDFLTKTYCRPVICDDFIGKGIAWSTCDRGHSNRSAIHPKILWITSISVGRRKLSFFQKNPLAFER